MPRENAPRPGENFSWDYVYGGLRRSRPAGYSTGWRSLPFLLLEWPEGGWWLLECEGREPLQIHPGEVLCVAPGLSHRLVAHPGGAMLSNWAMFSCHDGLGQSLLEARGIEGKIPPSAAARLKRLLRRLAQNHPAGAGSDRRLQLERRLLALGVMKLLLQAMPGAFTPPREPDARVTVALRLIQSNFMHRIGRDEIAGAMGLSPGRCHAIFVAATGFPPVRYLHQTRLQHAQGLLLLTELSVKEIAERSGFESLPYFCRYFRRRRRQTPTDYRRRARAGHDAIPQAGRS